MSTGILIAIFVACIWGLNPIFEKISLNTASPLSVITIRFVFTTCCLLIFVLATGRFHQVFSVDKMTLFWILLSGVVGGMIGLFLYLTALKMDNASTIIPIIASFPMFTAIYAYFILKEELSLTKIIGILFVVLGAILINWKSVIKV